MSGEIRQVTVTVTTRDTEDLPEGVTHDDVAREVRSVIDNAVTDWYWSTGLGGRDTLKCPPDIF